MLLQTGGRGGMAWGWRGLKWVGLTGRVLQLLYNQSHLEAEPGSCSRRGVWGRGRVAYRPAN